MLPCTSLVTSLALAGGDVLTPDGLIRDAVIHVADGRIQAISDTVGPDSREQRVDGAWVLPGLIDLHGDAFERSLMPRPGVEIPFGLALGECDHALLAAGVTTAFLAATDSFEPGLRGRATLRRLVQALEIHRPQFGCDIRLHVRRERCTASGGYELESWLEAGCIGLFSFADHVPLPGETAKRERYLRALGRRLPGSDRDLESLLDQAAYDRAAGSDELLRLLALARTLGVPLASHDDGSPAEVEAHAALGVRICEFPSDLATASRADELDQTVLMGAPNAVRQASHLGLLTVEQARRSGVLGALCSDYHYPSLLAAPLAMVDSGLCSLAQAWHWVSAAPAAAANLADKGRLMPGASADLLILAADPPHRLEQVLVAGRVVARWDRAGNQYLL